MEPSTFAVMAACAVPAESLNTIIVRRAVVVSATPKAIPNVTVDAETVLIKPVAFGLPPMPPKRPKFVPTVPLVLSQRVVAGNATDVLAALQYCSNPSRNIGARLIL